MELQITAPTEAATQRFGEQMQLIPGVTQVERFDDGTTDQTALRVTVRNGDREARYAVYRLETDMYLQHEGARLDIRVVEEQEDKG
jgi:hypothetical protein